MKKLLISLAIILLVLLLILPLALKLLFPEEKLRAMALPRAEAALQRSIGLEEISLGFGIQGLALKMRELSLGPDSLGTGLERLDIPKLDARLAWGPLLRREIGIRSLRIEGAQVFLRPAPPETAGPGGETAPTGSRASGLAFAVAAPDIQLKNSRLHLQLPEEDRPLALKLPLMRFASLLSAEGELDLAGHIELDGIEGGLPETMEHGGRLGLDFELALPLSAFEGELDPALLNLVATLSADDLSLRRESPQPLSVEFSSFETTLSASGGVLSLEIAPLELRSSSLPGPLKLEECRLAGDTGRGELRLETLKLSRGESRIVASGDVQGLPADPVMSIDLRSPLIDLGGFLPPPPAKGEAGDGEAPAPAAAPLLPPLPEGVILFEVDRLLHPRAELTGLRGRVLVGPEGVKLEDLKSGLYDGELSGRLAMSPDETDPTRLDILGEFDVKGSQAPAFFAAFSPIDRGVEGIIGTALNFAFKLRPGEKPEALSLDADLDLQNGALQGLPYLRTLARVAGLPEKEHYAIGRVRQHVQVADDRVITRDLRLPFEDGWIELGGSAGLAGDLDFDGRWEPGPATVAKLGQGDLYKWLADAEGKVTLDFHLGGMARSPVVTLDTSALQQRLLDEGKRRLQEELERKLKDDGGELLKQGLDALRERLK